jgi:hypothetical protein
MIGLHLHVCADYPIRKVDRELTPRQSSSLRFLSWALSGKRTDWATPRIEAAQTRWLAMLDPAQAKLTHRAFALTLTISCPRFGFSVVHHSRNGDAIHVVAQELDLHLEAERWQRTDPHGPFTELKMKLHSEALLVRVFCSKGRNWTGTP